MACTSGNFSCLEFALIMSRVQRKISLLQVYLKTSSITFFSVKLPGQTSKLTEIRIKCIIMNLFKTFEINNEH